MISKKQKRVYLDIKKGAKNVSKINIWENFNDFKNKSIKNKSVLSSKGRTTDKFFTEDSKLYITPKESKLLEEGIDLDRGIGKWDSLSSRIVRDYMQYSPSGISIMQRRLRRSYARLQEDVSEKSNTILNQFSMVRLWNLSIVGAILLGMFSMTMIYRYLGQGATASNGGNLSPIANELSVESVPMVAGVADARISQEDADEYTEHLLGEVKISKKEELEKEIMDMVKGYPIEEMVPYIAEKDRIVAAFLVGIAKKESNWGKRVPVLEGQDCYNYWGYRGIRKLMGTGGHTCFNSRKDAVDTVAKRIQALVEKQEIDTPEKMIIWKCGSTCAGHSNESVRKWISDVNMYFKELR